MVYHGLPTMDFPCNQRILLSQRAFPHAISASRSFELARWKLVERDVSGCPMDVSQESNQKHNQWDLNLMDASGWMFLVGMPNGCFWLDPRTNFNDRLINSCRDCYPTGWQPETQPVGSESHFWSCFN